jgi:hypothetical protein
VDNFGKSNHCFFSLGSNSKGYRESILAWFQAVASRSTTVGRRLVGQVNAETKRPCLAFDSSLIVSFVADESIANDFVEVDANCVWQVDIEVQLAGILHASTQGGGARVRDNGEPTSMALVMMCAITSGKFMLASNAYNMENAIDSALEFVALAQQSGRFDNVALIIRDVELAIAGRVQVVGMIVVAVLAIASVLQDARKGRGVQSIRHIIDA